MARAEYSYGGGIMLSDVSIPGLSLVTNEELAIFRGESFHDGVVIVISNDSFAGGVVAITEPARHKKSRNV
jgi:hypothetical protein